MARTKTTPKTGAKTGAKTNDHKLPVTGFRIPQDILDGLDAYVERLNASAPEGFSTNRNAIVVKILRDAVNAANAELPPEDKPEH